MEVDFPIGGAVGNGEYLTPLEQNACQILSGYTSEVRVTFNDLHTSHSYARRYLPLHGTRQTLQ